MENRRADVVDLRVSRRVASKLVALLKSYCWMQQRKTLLKMNQKLSEIERESFVVVMRVRVLARKAVMEQSQEMLWKQQGQLYS